MNFVTRSEFREVLLSLSNDIQKLREAIHESGKTREVNSGPEKRTVLAKLDSVSSIETHTPNKEQKKESRYQFWSLILSGLTLLAVAAYAVITGQMRKEMRTQTGVSQTNSINSERAWVGLDGPVTIDLLEVMPQLKVESHYSVKNFGHGPGFKVFAHGQFWSVPKLYENFAKSACIGPIEVATGTVPTVPRLRNPGPMGYTLFTNQTHQETMGSPRDPWQGAGEPDLKHFWFIGCVAYLDQFKTVHWTRFCMEPSFSPQDFNKDIPLQFCALYNDAGDGEPPK